MLRSDATSQKQLSSLITTGRLYLLQLIIIVLRLRKARLARGIMFYVRLSIRLSVTVTNACEYDTLNTNELILMPFGTCDQRVTGRGHETIKFGTRKSKVRVTGRPQVRSGGLAEA